MAIVKLKKRDNDWHKRCVINIRRTIMEKNHDLEEKMELLKKMNTDNSRYLYRICKAFKNYNEEMNRLKENINIEINNKETNIENGFINLDDIDCEKYFNTRMKQNIITMVKEIINIPSKNFYIDKNICKKIIYSKEKNYISHKDYSSKLDIVELIKILDKEKITNIKIVARNINDENIFKYCELMKAKEIIENNDVKIRNEMIYNHIYEYLNKDFISNKYCDFIDDKCVAQRHFNLYPVTSKDGCCFKRIRKCEHLNNGTCKVECMACRLFTCPYLTKRGIGYWANEFILFNAFFNKNQRKHLVFDFYKSKEQVLGKLNNN